MKTYVLLLSVLTNAAFADAIMLSPPVDTRTCNYDFSFCAHSSVEAQETTVYAMQGAFEKTELYKFKGWFRQPFIAPDGRYFVAGYHGLNLLPRNFTPDTVMLHIFDNGTLVRQVRLKELFNSLASLQETASHYHWGVIHDVYDVIRIETTEGEVLVTVPEGEVYLPRKQPDR